ncbi:uncharacterized protein DS421_12g370230 [Arachis hypogaea]|nr:uncharacterized protein DS421_12g370230 [Arachis hypogaea]
MPIAQPRLEANLPRMVGSCFVPMVRGRCCEPRGRKRTLVVDSGAMFTMRSRERGGEPRNCKNEEEGCLAEIKYESGRVEVNGRCCVRDFWVGWVPVFVAAEFIYV